MLRGIAADMRTRRHETLRFPTAGDTTNLSIKLYHHKTLGKDKEVGEAVVDVSVVHSAEVISKLNLPNRHLSQVRKYMQPPSSGAEELVTLSDGHASVLLKFDFEVGPGKVSRLRSPSVHSKAGSTSNNSPSKFSMTKK